MAEAAAAKPRGVPPPQAVGGRSPAGTAPRLPLSPAGTGEREEERGEPTNKVPPQGYAEAHRGKQRRGTTRRNKRHGERSDKTGGYCRRAPRGGRTPGPKPEGAGQRGVPAMDRLGQRHARGRQGRPIPRKGARRQPRAGLRTTGQERAAAEGNARTRPERNAGGKAPRPGSGSGAMRRTGTAKRRPGPPGQHRRALLPKSSASAGCAVPTKAGFSPLAGTTSGVWAEPNGDGMPPNANGGVGQGPRPRRCKCGITMYPPRGLGPRGGMCQTERAHASGSIASEASAFCGLSLYLILGHYSITLSE